MVVSNLLLRNLFDPFTLSLSKGFDKLSPNGIQDIPRPDQG